MAEYDHVPIEDCDPAIRAAVAGIRSATGVWEDSVAVWLATPEWGSKHGRLQIRFDLAGPVLARPAVTFHEREPFAFAWWGSQQDVEWQAPWVFSLRDDFPRNLSHLNPFPADWWVSPCLALARLDALYERFGTRGIVDRLREWLRDAAADALTIDGWHPVPRAETPPGHSSIEAMADAAWLQEQAVKGASSGFLAGIATSTIAGLEQEQTGMVVRCAALDHAAEAWGSVHPGREMPDCPRALSEVRFGLGRNPMDIGVE